MGFLDFISNNKDWLAPLAQVGLGAGQAYSQYSQSQNQADNLEDQNKANYDAYVQYQNYKNAAGASSAAAASANGRAKLAALKKAMAEKQKYFDLATGYLKPYQEAALSALPQSIENYQKSLSLFDQIQNNVTPGMLSAALGTPQSASSVKLKNYIPATAIKG